MKKFLVLIPVLFAFAIPQPAEAQFGLDLFGKKRAAAHYAEVERHHERHHNLINAHWMAQHNHNTRMYAEARVQTELLRQIAGQQQMLGAQVSEGIGRLTAPAPSIPGRLIDPAPSIPGRLTDPAESQPGRLDDPFTRQRSRSTSRHVYYVRN